MPRAPNSIKRRKTKIEAIAVGFEWPEKVLAMMRRSNNSRFKGKLYEYQLAMVTYLLELVYSLAIGCDFNVSRAKFRSCIGSKAKFVVAVAHWLFTRDLYSNCLLE